MDEHDGRDVVRVKPDTTTHEVATTREVATAREVASAFRRTPDSRSFARPMCESLVIHGHDRSADREGASR